MRLLKYSPCQPVIFAGQPTVAAAIVTVYDFVEVAPSESDNAALTKKVPAAFGVPEIVPLAVSIDSPLGRPAADHVYGTAPPVADGVVGLKALPTCPFGSADGHVAVNGVITFSVKLFVPAAVRASATAAATVNVPAAVGVPEMMPVEESMANPAGSPEADQTYGVVPPVAVGFAEVYATPTSPSGIDTGHVTTSAGFTVIAYAFVAVAVMASVMVRDTLNVPAVVGEPEIAPVDELIVRPGGSPLPDHTYGAVPPLADGVGAL